MNDHSRLHMWRLFGWFCGLMLCGSCFGAVTWAAWMQRMVYNFKGSVDSTAWTQRTSLYALSIRWIVVFTVTYPIEFLCLSVAKLMVLDRMAIFSGVSKKLHLCWRVVTALVVAGSVAGLVGNIFAAVQFQQCAESYSMSSASYLLNNTVDGQKYFAVSQSCMQTAFNISSVQIYCETVVLLLSCRFRLGCW